MARAGKTAKKALEAGVQKIKRDFKIRTA